MRSHLLLAVSAAALMALPAVAQETDQATEQPETTTETTTETTEGGAAATEQPATEEPAADTGAATETQATETEATETEATGEAATEATEGEVVTTTEGGDAAQAATEAPAEGAAPAGDPMQALSSAAERLREVGEQMQNSAAIAVDGTTGTTTEGGTDVTADSAAATTEGTATADLQQMQADATTALDDFDAALTQVSAEGDQGMQEQVTQLQAQSQEVRQQLTDDPANAGEDMQSLADAALQLQVANIPAEADAIVGRQIVTADGEEAGEVRDVLVTADGQVEALLIERGGALGLGGQQVAVTWDQLQLQGDQITINMTQDEIEQLPEYQTE